MASATDTLILIHRIIGYPTAFIVAPLGLLAFATPRVHRRWGRAYFYLMLFLYLTGTYLTLTLNRWNSWGFARNLTFNFFGFSMLLYEYRAIRLFSRGAVAPDRIDRALAKLLTLSVLALFLVAVWKDTPLRIFTLLGIWLCVVEWREVRQGAWTKPVLFRRHMRYIFASYFYVLTVVSIVHLKDELPKNVRWLWPTALAILVIWLLRAGGQATGKQAFSGRLSQGTLTRCVVLGVFGLSILYGGYIAYDLLYGAAIQGQG